MKNKKAIIEITVGDKVEICVKNPDNDINNPAYQLAMAIANLALEVGGESR